MNVDEWDNRKTAQDDEHSEEQHTACATHQRR
jgi:hypothetical protein